MRFFKQFHSRFLVYTSGAAVALAVAAIAASRFGGQPASPNQTSDAAVPITAGVSLRENVPEIVNALGTVQSIDSVAVQARVTGAIEKIEFTPGQDVKQGQELFLIDPRPFQAALDAAQAQLAHDQGVLAEAQVDLARFQLLAQQNSIAKQQAQDQAYLVDQDKGTVQLDEANVETARLNLEYCHVTAPITGRAGALLVDLGNLVGPTTQTSTNGAATATPAGTTSQTINGAMVTIAQIKPIYVSFNVAQDMLDEIKRGQAAAPLTAQAYSPDGKLLETGKLTLIDNAVNTNTGTVLMQATFANADEALWPGEFVRVQLIVAIRRNVVTVPAQAVMAGPSSSYVYVIGPDGTVHRVDVEVTARHGGTDVISKGLSGDERIVVDGQYRLANGVRVEAAPAAEASK